MWRLPYNSVLFTIWRLKLALCCSLKFPFLVRMWSFPRIPRNVMEFDFFWSWKVMKSHGIWTSKKSMNPDAYSGTTPIVFMKHIIVLRHDRLRNNIKPMQPHFNAQPLARWQHSIITKWRLSKWRSCSYNSCVTMDWNVYDIRHSRILYHINFTQTRHVSLLGLKTWLSTLEIVYLCVFRRRH